MNAAAQKLGRQARGVPKHYSAAEIELRRERLAKAREKRWPKCKAVRKPDAENFTH